MVGQPLVAYAYDPVTGNLHTITATDGGTLTFAYDGTLLLSETWAGAVNGSVSRTYDNDFRVASQRVNGSNTVSFSYDADSLLTGAGALGVTRDPQNGLVTATTLDQVTDTTTYNEFGEPLTYEARFNATALYAVEYARDQLGRISEKTETIGGATHVDSYTYDLAGRLTDVTTGAVPTAHYGYDANGNRIGGSTAAGAISGTQYDDQDRLLAVTLGLSPTSYAYTANGELATRIVGAGTTSYGCDVLGNLLSVTKPDGTVIEYLVDGKNRRIGKKVNGAVVQGFLYDGRWRVVAELDGAGNLVGRFVYGERPNVPEYLLRGGVAYRILSDHLGSPRLVVNAADGTIAQRMDYDAFGNVLVDTNPGFQPFGFAGGLYDPDTGLVRFGARDYDPQTGRWTAKDPIGFGGGDPNLYGYVLQDPVNAVDPRGLDIWIEGPGPGENPFHVSINVGNPNDPSHIFSVSFGLAATKYPFILGYAYLDQVHGGPILVFWFSGNVTRGC